MIAYVDARAGYAVRDTSEAMAFYQGVLGLEVVEVALGKTDEVPKGLKSGGVDAWLQGSIQSRNIAPPSSRC